MNSTLIAGLSSGSVDASLTEVDARTKDSDKLRNGIVNVGPFDVFSLSDRHPIDQAEVPLFYTRHRCTFGLSVGIYIGSRFNTGHW